MLCGAKIVPYKLDALQNAQRFESHWLGRRISNLSGTQVITMRPLVYGTFFEQHGNDDDVKTTVYCSPSSSSPFCSKILLFFFSLIFVHFLKAFNACHHHYCAPRAVFPLSFLLFRLQYYSSFPLLFIALLLHITHLFSPFFDPPYFRQPHLCCL
jgi:hypothetical protein